MLPDIQKAIRLQTLDDRIAELTKEIAALPKHIAEIEKKLEIHQRRLDHDKAALSANQKDRKKLEMDIQVQDQKASKLRDQMMGAKTNEQYHAFQHEITFCQTEVRRIEDKILELMGESEALDKNVKVAEVALAAEKKEVEKDKTDARDRTAVDQNEIKALQADRGKVTVDMTPSALSLYERIRKSRAGIAVAEAVDGRCSRCHVMMRLQLYQELKHADRIITCESCNRILYYIPVQSVVDMSVPTPS
jgi:hypothetical protein